MVITDEQLAEWAALISGADPGTFYVSESGEPEYEAKACNAFPALVAEVHRLRTELAIAQEQAGRDQRKAAEYARETHESYDRAEAAEAEVSRLQELRDKDAMIVLALHEAAGGNKGLSSADLLEYTRLAMKRVRAEVRREALEEASEECRKYAEWCNKADDGLSGHGYRADAAADLRLCHPSPD